MTVFDVLLSLIVLAPMGAVGIALLWRLRLGLDPLEWVAYGIPFGWVLSSLLLYGICLLQGRISTLVVLVYAVFLVALTLTLVTSDDRLMSRLAALLSGARDDDTGEPEGARRAATHGGPAVVGLVAGAGGPPRGLASLGRLTPARLGGGLPAFRVSWLPTVTFAVLAVVWYVFWQRMIMYGPDGINVGHLWFWTDGALHMGDIAGMVYGDNFPVQDLRFEGNLYGYHLLTSVTAASLVTIGLTPFSAICVTSWMGWLLIALSVYAIARRVLRSTTPAILAMLLYVLGGNLSWMLFTVREFNASGDLIGTLRDNAYNWDGELQEVFGYSNWNFYWVFFLAQRSYQYGIPIFALVLALLFSGLRSGRRAPFVVAGVAAGTAPLSSLPLLLGLAFLLPFFALFSPTGRDWRRPWTVYPIVNWLLFGVVTAAVALPLLLYQHGAVGGGFRIDWDPAWILQGSTQPLWFYWLKATGVLGVFVLVGLFLRRGMPARARVLLWASIPTVAIVTLWVFQPWSADNHKLFVYAWIGVTIGVAAVIAELWRRSRSAVPRVVLAILAFSLLLTGLVTNISAVAAPQTWTLGGGDMVRLGEWARDETPPHAIFATNQRHNNPITMIGGRRMIVGYSGWLWVRGYDIGAHEAALDSILTYGPDAERDIDAWGVDYVVIGPGEIDDYDADRDAYLERYPVAYDADDIVVFAVSDQAIALAVADGATVPEAPAASPDASAASTTQPSSSPAAIARP